MRRPTRETVTRVTRALSLAATATGFWLAAGAPLYRSF